MSKRKVALLNNLSFKYRLALDKFLKKDYIQQFFSCVQGISSNRIGGIEK